MDYDFFYRAELSPSNIDSLEVDVFLSAFNKSERVNTVFSNIKAENKFWVFLAEYQFAPSETDSASGYVCDPGTESQQMINYIDYVEDKLGCNISDKAVCMDITGFLRPQMLFIIKLAFQRGLKKLLVIYSEPERYKQNEKTQFSKGNISVVRQVEGFEGSHNANSDNDLLIIGSGYDDLLVSSVADDKEHAKKLQLIGFPSLSPDMYQQNILNLIRTVESTGVESIRNPIYAPADDPFKTASAISSALVNFEMVHGTVSNLYLSPLSTKAQALGFALYYMFEKENSNTSLIFPFTEYYQQETTKGCSKINLYTIEFP